MDELELLKKDWKNKENDYPTLSYDEIYKMIHSKSSSIVKWIFIISMIELGLGLLLALLNPNIDTKIKLPDWTTTLTYLSYPIILFFIYRFYINYKTISATDNVKKLIANIIKTRRTVKYYVLFNVVFGAIIFAVGLYLGFGNSPEVIENLNTTASSKKYLVIIATVVIATALFVGLILAIYYLLYGLLLRRLNRNYKELKKIQQ
ncbi:hypothetical protein RM697_01980 [Ichthyenterobacterium sp. W332]|uniref:Uncharacterized protein n=1 Tax=Microcosmobacter mediterraneus TaxID=3075607 RepID=A0ABU2YK30_9FLAO|nr:hypothetical protein [Ichthyenterobacterium sp. W332]MDT0557398.1 hypothetical protein [Ichthyenterobacterium sp. W332]